jgi:hypothetical protein
MGMLFCIQNLKHLRPELNDYADEDLLPVMQRIYEGFIDYVLENIPLKTIDTTGIRADTEKKGLFYVDNITLSVELKEEYIEVGGSPTIGMILFSHELDKYIKNLPQV